MPPDTDATGGGESTDGSTGGLAAFERRPLLKAVGVGAALSVGSGVAAGRRDGDEIDPVYGYPVGDTAEIPEDLRADHEVQLTGAPPDPEAGSPPAFIFEPTGIHVQSGDIVQFTFDTPDHTVTAYHEAMGFGHRVPEQSPPFSSPIVAVGGAWLYRFEHEGMYDLYCGPHHPLGMVMRVVVGDLPESEYPEYLENTEGIPPFAEEFEALLVEFSEENESVEWIFPSPREILTTSALDPGRIQDEGTVPYSAVLSELAAAEDEGE